MRSLMQTKPHLHDYSVRNTSFPANGIWVVEAKNADIYPIAKTLRYSEGTHQRLNADAIADIIIVCHYSVSALR
jgi:hypothetical protein